MSVVLAVVEHDAAGIDEVGGELLSAGRAMAATLDAALEAVLIGPGADGAVEAVARYGATGVHVVTHPLLDAYAPAAHAAGVAAVMDARQPVAVIAAGTEKGNEVLAHVAAVTDLPMAANCTEVTPDAAGDGRPWEVTRVRWGGSLLEDARLDAPLKLLTVAPHAFEATPLTSDVGEVVGAEDVGAHGVGAGGVGAGGVGADRVGADRVGAEDVGANGVGADRVGAGIERFDHRPELDPATAAVHVVDHEPAGSGVSLSSAPVVVSGGRGVGGADGFAVLEELAGLLGGAVGCSRVATNNGWRSHSDQVGQTGTKVAPQLYIACGISGATQHWVGCKDAKHILAINTDPEAPLVTRGDYAVIGSLQEVLPAIVDEVRRRRGPS